MLADEPSSSRPVDVSSSAKERAKGVIEDGYETGSDIDPKEVRGYNEGFTWLEVRLEGSSRTIVILIDHVILVKTEDVVPSVGHLCSNVEGGTLATFNDAALSAGIAGLALKVSFPIFLVFMPCILSSSFFRLDLLCSFYRPSSWRLRVLVKRRAAELPSKK